MKILVFLHGTTIVHQGAAGKTRAEIIKQVIEQESSVRDFSHYIPIGQAPQKLQAWVAQGAEICYLSGLTRNKKAKGDEIVGEQGLKAEEVMLQQLNFPPGTIYHREAGGSYQDVVGKISPLPDVLIEDDCASIGASEMTYLKLSQDIKQHIKHIVVQEFTGLDHLPDDPILLQQTP